jgi:hypothetical protein
MKPIDIINGLIGVDTGLLTTKQRQVQLMMDFHSEVVNGGWDQYLLNSSGDGANALMRIAPRLGYQGVAVALELIAQRMGGNIPEDRGQREPLLEALLSTLSESENDHISDLIEADVHQIFDDMYEFVEHNLDDLSAAHVELRSKS